jgi:hypothetical protein
LPELYLSRKILKPDTPCQLTHADNVFAVMLFKDVPLPQFIMEELPLKLLPLLTGPAASNVFVSAALLALLVASKAFGFDDTHELSPR